MTADQVKLIKGGLALVVVSELINGQINRKRCNRNAKIAQELRESNECLCEALQTSLNQTDYVMQKLNEAGIPMTEFDAIALNSLT